MMVSQSGSHIDRIRKNVQFSYSGFSIPNPAGSINHSAFEHAEFAANIVFCLSAEEKIEHHSQN
jgi:hypothetical protein